MGYHDDSTGSDYHSTLRLCYYGDEIFTVFGISGEPTDAEVHTVSRKGFAGGNFRHAGGVLPEKRKRIYRKSRLAGTDCDCAGGGASFMEAEYVTLHCGRNGMLYVAGAVGVLGKPDEMIIF